ncbi:uncharacterized protein LACBIDRAFT_328924 [Laccaria bicolor S238N-H82]|uniref:Predicted protein n=1 Tax=Laccaria bicolor (strain S238N-H82 / ATCC MYA-4686) TaxID=486041 RepID=B0DGG3_LACBS|nr:uncharacterized protein LACBIDRAFT_328924 [Laccaria bicolor S238N-H82]EDR06262.1 predicted protein [Laccaria bicolor S238N-H82]|eukprot:XP_001883123.1 predicted protein [Laccaria bicolor S238N-H82]
MPSSFTVKNNGKNDVFVFLEKPSLAVTVPPGQTSLPFSSPGTYIIRSELENLPLPPPEIVVAFAPGETFETKSINRPNLNVDITAKFDFGGGDLISSLISV